MLAQAFKFRQMQDALALTGAGQVCYTSSHQQWRALRAPRYDRRQKETRVSAVISLFTRRAGASDYDVIKERAVPTINFVREGKKVQVEVGESLRYAALDNDIPLYSKFGGMANFIQCHGNGLCGTDEVIVSPANAVNPPTWQEKLNENIPPFGPLRQKQRGTRLACQVIVNGDIDVITGVGFISPKPEKLLNETRGRR
ncbi:MAG TPA: hypothetical protein VFU69_17590 [Ktedonobacterales bacterium]|nr:hypothetical protein [Ktedonobacterales bacterium]